MVLQLRARRLANSLLDTASFGTLYAFRRVDSRSTSLGGISILFAGMGRFDAIRSMRSSAASAPMRQVP
jgi:hypothetical protein